VVDEVELSNNRWKSRTRAKVEHGIGLIKRAFGFVKVRYGAGEEHPSRARCM
jgi:hypothetical protein